MKRRCAPSTSSRPGLVRPRVCPAGYGSECFLRPPDPLWGRASHTDVGGAHSMRSPSSAAHPPCSRSRRSGFGAPPRQRWWPRLLRGFRFSAGCALRPPNFSRFRWWGAGFRGTDPVSAFR
ncbi:hypothetical protein NDU88_005341 [Pleurodeles waltl]|uniref:Uncharacterized protein n=1 Tax=Pleurodeles waltl TaxID=8319 RepID=A0AAV7LMK9_PLEWA|nr:hypothetical protein NDU88_005341 [Pleurodeles waltl]